MCLQLVHQSAALAGEVVEQRPELCRRVLPPAGRDRVGGVVVEQPPQPRVLRDQAVDEGEGRTGRNGGETAAG